RIPRGMSVILLRSFCPHCKQELRWFEIIPLISFAIQWGRCRSCFTRIPSQYPLVEVVTATLALFLFALHGFSFQLIWSFSFISLMALVAVIDWRCLLIPNKVVISGLVIGVVLKILVDRDDLLSRIVDALLASADRKSTRLN